MCLILIALDAHPEYSLIIAANRDEFYDRPTAPAAFWADAPSVLAGRDLKAGGTWLGVDRGRRLAAVTNYRQGQRESEAPKSRGHLVSEFLTKDIGPREYMDRVNSEAGLYNGFNLIAGDATGLFYYSNREGRVRRLAPGVYGLSNHLLDTPWPKVAATKTAFGTLVSAGASDPIADLFALLTNRDRASDGQLPSTGVGREWERLLSSAFIASDDYGTRSSTVVLVGRDGRTVFVERSFGPGVEPGTEARFEMHCGSDKGLPRHVLQRRLGRI
jgi:uncharacterized protein with NRDE domain